MKTKKSVPSILATVGCYLGLGMFVVFPVLCSLALRSDFPIFGIIGFVLFTAFVLVSIGVAIFGALRPDDGPGIDEESE